MEIFACVIYSYITPGSFSIYDTFCICDIVWLLIVGSLILLLINKWGGSLMMQGDYSMEKF